MAARGITIRWFASNFKVADINIIDGVRVRIEIECAHGMADKVFAYRMLQRNPRTGETAGFFSHVCSPSDIAEFPEDEPVTGYAPEWFRLSYVDVLIRSMVEAEDFITLVREDIRSLKKTLDRMDTIIPEGMEVVGTLCPVEEPEPNSSDSASIPASSESIGAQQAICCVGTTEQATGFGADWVEIGEGAGTPIGISDSLASNYQRSTLIGGRSTSKLLIVQGFDFRDIPNDAIVDGIIARLVIRDATSLLESASSEAVEGSSMSTGDIQCARVSFLAIQHPELGLGTNKALLECISGPEWQAIMAGSAFDTWGFSAVRGEDLKRGEFGLSLVVCNDAEVDESVIDVDGVELCVYYRNVY